MHVSQHQPSTGPEPSAGTARRSLYVPVRQGPAGSVIRLWRTPVGTRTAVAFTTDRRLRSVLGPTQAWIRLSEEALRRMAEPMGALHLTVDPVLTARPPASWSRPESQSPSPSQETPAPETGATSGRVPEAASKIAAPELAPESAVVPEGGPESGSRGLDATPA